MTCTKYTEKINTKTLDLYLFTNSLPVPQTELVTSLKHWIKARVFSRIRFALPSSENRSKIIPRKNKYVMLFN